MTEIIRDVVEYLGFVILYFKVYNGRKLQLIQKVLRTMAYNVSMNYT
ncbi:hypothetical protein KGM_205043 [Danaus plexippus plexippus]|uniref:Uncharacterized protein n=1 Tax=Danaus plexippus plexippus TaxID=278856 RepID=A0A212ENU9_DANPL|nr:hypothetical protein KGM_205043 [Danaus plexippus plexippus]